MKRKLVQMGKGCLMSAIPKKWLDQNHLKKGDHIEFNVNDNYLLITSKPKIIAKETNLNLKEANKTATYRILNTLYDLGFTKITIEYENQETLTHILSGISVLEEWKLEPINKNKCVIKTFYRDEEDIKVLFRRALLFTKELINEMTTYMESKNDDVTAVRTKYMILYAQLQSIKRLINTSVLPLEYKHYYFITMQLENIGDHYEYLLRNIEKVKRITKQEIVLQKKLATLYEEVYDLIYSFNADRYVKFHKEVTIWKWFENITNTETTYNLRVISDSMRNMIKYSVGISMK